MSAAVETEAAEGDATVALKVLGLVGTANLLGEDAADCRVPLTRC